MQPKVDNTTDLMTMYAEYPWGDLWSDAELLEVFKYVRGAKSFKMPPEWKAVFPTSLPSEDCEND